MLFAYGACASAPPPRPSLAKGDVAGAQEYLDSLIRSLMRRHRIPGMAVAVVHEGKILYLRCLGAARAGDRSGLPAGTRFMAGSLTKSFTALAVMRLIREGAVDPGADIKKYLPEFSMKTADGAEPVVTVRHLLTHTSGLMIDYYARFTGERKYKDRELLSLLRGEYLCFAPGTAVKYSNIGYRLLGMIVERRTGMPFERYLKESVLGPLGMGESGFEHDGHLASGHDGERRNKAIPLLDIGDSAASGLITTIGDLAAFLRYLSGDGDPAADAPDPAEYVEMIRRYADARIDTYYDNGNTYSAGWYLDFYRFRGTGTVMSNSGNVNGFSSELVYVPDARLGMAVLCNSSLGWKAELEIAARGLASYLEAVRGLSPNGDLKGGSAAPCPARDEDRAGRYAGFGVMVDVMRRGRSYYAGFKGPAARLVPLGDGLYAGRVGVPGLDIDVSRFSEYDRVRFRFRRNREGAAFLFMEASYGDSAFSIPLHRTVRVPIPDEFSGRTGVWELVADSSHPGILELYLPSRRLGIHMRDGWLLMETATWMGKGLIVLEPLSAHAARIAGSGEVIMFEGEELRFIGLRFRKRR